jgi:hypothetical protein
VRDVDERTVGHNARQMYQDCFYKLPFIKATFPSNLGISGIIENQDVGWAVGIGSGTRW